MAGAIVGLHVFGPDTGPEPLSNLDNNYSAIVAAINALNTYANYYVDSGAVNAMVITTAAGQTVSYTDGLTLMVLVGNTTTSTAPTLNVNGLGAKSIVNPDNTAITVGQLVAGMRVFFTYDGVNNVWQVSSLTRGLMGGTVVPAPATGVALAVNGAAGFAAITGQGNSTTGRGIIALAGANVNSDVTFAVQNTTGTVTFFVVRGDGSVSITDNAASPALFAAGYLGAPQNAQNANYTLVLSDQGKSIYHSVAGAHTWTIPANASVAFPTGTAIMLVNAGAGAVTLNITTDTLSWFPTNATGSRTLNTGTMASLYKQTNTQWIISGVGVS